MDNLHNEALTLKEELKLLWKGLTIGHLLLYFLGMVLIAAGVALMLRSSVGVSSWDTLHFSLQELTGISFGTAMLFTAVTATVLTIALQKNLKYLLMLIPIVMVALFTDLFNDRLFVSVTFDTLFANVAGFALGLSMLPLGGSMLIVSGLPAGVFDEFMLAIMKVFRSSNIPLVRAIMELTVVVLAIVLGFAAGIGFGKVSIGTLIFSLTIGWYLKTYLKLFERIGWYERKQTD